MSSANTTSPTTAAEAAAEYEALLQTLYQLQSVYWASAGALACLVYDILLTLDNEIAFIWKAQWSLPKVLYLLARYYGLFSLAFYLSVMLSPTVSVETCAHFFWFDGLSSSLFFTTTVNLIFALRVNALYGNKRGVLALVLFLWILEFSIETTNVVLTESSVKSIPRTPGLPILGCSGTPPSRTAHLTLFTWILCLIVACAYYLLTAYGLARNMEVRIWSDMRLMFSRVRAYPIMEVFFRDGSLFFGMIFVIILLNTAFQTVGGGLEEVGEPWLSAVYSIAGSRLILNLRAASTRPDSDSDRLAMSSFSANTFRAAPPSEEDSEYLGAIPLSVFENDTQFDV